MSVNNPTELVSCAFDGRSLRVVKTPPNPPTPRYVPIDGSVMAEIKTHLHGRTSGYVFETRNGTPFRLNNVLEDSLHPLLDELGIPRTGMHAFRRGQISEWVYSDVKRQVIRDWAGHG